MEIRLSDLQKTIVAHDEGCLLVLAGPGAGKTRVVTERVRRLLHSADANFRVLALTFTNKAANEMNDRLGGDEKVRDRAFIGTLHSFCTEIISDRGKRVGVNGLPHVLEAFDDRKQALRDAVETDEVLRHALMDREAKRRESALSEWLGVISEFKRRLITPDLVRNDFERRLYSAYDAELRTSAVLDFDDLLLLAYRLFEENPKIANFYRRQYPYVCIDEAQDLNEAQYRVLCALCGDTHRNVIMVGDPKQAIYTWNGANPKYLDLFARDFSAPTIELDENFRCARTVVRAAQLLDESYNVSGQLAIEGEVNLAVCQNEVDEARFIAESIARLLEDGHRDIEGRITPERIAVLARTRYAFGELEAALREREILFHRRLAAGDAQPTSRLVSDFKLALRLSANPHNRIHLRQLVQVWDIPLELEDVRARIRDLDGPEAIGVCASLARRGSPQTALRALRDSQSNSRGFDLPRGLRVLESESEAFEDDEREVVLLDVQEWFEIWDSYVRSTPGGSHSLGSFLTQMALGVTDHGDKEGVALLTVHTAKGTEFDVVFVLGLAEGAFPIYHARTPAERAEERRNAFVACTRSQRLLFLTYPKTRRMPWGDLRRSEPSPYFREIWTEFPGVVRNGA